MIGCSICGWGVVGVRLGRSGVCVLTMFCLWIGIVSFPEGPQSQLVNDVTL